MSAAGNLIYQETTTTGTGNITLTAKTGFRAFSDQFSVATPFWYCIRDQTTGAFEVGVGELSSASVLVRSSVIQSSNANALVNFAAGTKDVICDVPASVQNTITSKGDVFGPASSTANALALYNGTTGKLIKDSTATYDSANGVMLIDGSLSIYNFTNGSVSAWTGVDLFDPDVFGFFGQGGQILSAFDLNTSLYSYNGGSLTGDGTDLTLAGVLTADNVLVDDEAFDPAWNGSLEVPTKNAVYDAIEATRTQTQAASGGVGGAVSNGDITIAIKMAFSGTITETTTLCSSGTATATFKIGTTALGGTANSVSTSRQSQAHASANFFTAGDNLYVTISSASSLTDLSYTIAYNRT